MSDSKCRSCGALVIWGRTKKGKAMILDAEPERRAVIIQGVTYIMPTYMPHWGTCPQAKDWKGAKR